MNKFKPGDKVRIRNNLGGYHRGIVFTVITTYDIALHGKRVKAFSLDGETSFPEGMLELLPDSVLELVREQMNKLIEALEKAGVK